MLTSKLFGVLSFTFGTVVLTAVPSYAAVIDFSTWQKIGDTITPASGSTSMSTDGLGGSQGLYPDDEPSPIGRYSYTKNTPAVDASNRNSNIGDGIATFQKKLGLINTSIDIFGQAFEGSAIQKAYTVNAGDKLTFNYQFLTSDVNPKNRDYGFLLVGTTVNRLVDTNNATPASSPFNKETEIGSYEYTFATPGTYNLAFGIVDIGEEFNYNDGYNGTSALQITNANLQAAPEPISVVSSIVALGCGASLRRRFGKKGMKR